MQWLKYSEVGGGTLHWPKLQCYTKTIVEKTKYNGIGGHERQFEVVEH